MIRHRGHKMLTSARPVQRPNKLCGQPLFCCAESSFSPVEHLNFSGKRQIISFVFSGHPSGLTGFCLLTLSTKLQRCTCLNKKTPVLWIRIHLCTAGHAHTHLRPVLFVVAATCMNLSVRVSHGYRHCSSHQRTSYTYLSVLYLLWHRTVTVRDTF